MDLGYPESLHDAHNKYSLSPEEILVETDMLLDVSPQFKMFNVGSGKVEKVVSNLNHKHRCIVHYCLLYL